MTQSSNGKTTVLLVDDEALIRAGLRAIIDAEPDLVVVGEAGDGAEVLPLVRRLRPDVVLMDVRMRSGPSRRPTAGTRTGASRTPG